MRLSTPSSFPLLISTLAFTTIAHPVILSLNQPRNTNPVAAAVVPLQDHQLQLLLPQQSGTQRLVIARPQRETLSWRAEKWAVAVRWWKGAVTGVEVEEDSAGWSSEGVRAGDWVGDGEDGFRVMEAIEGDEEEEEAMECDAVDEVDEGDEGDDDDDEEEEGQMEL